MTADFYYIINITKRLNMKNVKITHYTVIRLPGNGVAQTEQLCNFDAEHKSDFDKWCVENLPGLYAKHGRDSICCRKHYSDGEMTYFAKEV